ncbi:hypothetical protein EAE96_001839 [Botrytis aclada]|nr:hypothetical protein EAE96_001839 [Botrytis aclada]
MISFARVYTIIYLSINVYIIGCNSFKTTSIAKYILTTYSELKIIRIGGVDIRNIQNLKSIIKIYIKELGGIDFLISGIVENFILSFEDLFFNIFRNILEIDILNSFNIFKTTLSYLRKSISKYPNTASNPNTNNHIVFIFTTFYFTGIVFQGYIVAIKANVNIIFVTTVLKYNPGE